MIKGILTLQAGVFLIASLKCSRSGGDLKSDESSDAAEGYSRRVHAIEDVALIAQRVAEGIEALKVRYPHLENFSPAEDLRKTYVGGARLSHPDELYSISYHNGVIEQE